MNKTMIRIVAQIITLWLLMVLPKGALAKLIIKTPVDKSIIESGTLIIAGIEDSADKDEIEIKVKGTEYDEPAIFEDTTRIYDKEFNFEIDLYAGENEIIIGNKAFSVFYDDGSGITPPDTYKKFSIHKAVTDGCIECHDTEVEGLPLLYSKEELCKRCHPQYMKIVIVRARTKSGKIVKKKKEIMFENLHKPVLEGKCLKCHKPHVSENKKLLIKTPVSFICEECHAKVFDALKLAKEPHPPQEEGECILCHSPHASEEKYLFKRTLKATCFECHDSFYKNAAGKRKKSIHKYSKGGVCYECHDLHFSEMETAFINLPVKELCMKCHDDKDKGKHGSMKDSTCLTCHDPHASDNENILLYDKKKICSNCHNKAKGKVVHGALEKDSCQACHGSLHDLNDLEETKKNCKRCHDNKEQIKVVHGDFNIPEDKCSICHDSHSSSMRKLLSKEQHSPFQEGECDSCHENVDGEVKLSEQGSELCYQCHDSTEVEEDKIPLKNIHLPVRKGECTSCHDPHSSDFKKFLRAAPYELCLTCHNKLLNNATGGKLKTLHPPAEDGDCMECHSPHSSRQKKLLSEKIETLCFNCHDDFAEKLGDDANLHPPYEDRDCTACHSPHGTDANYLIKFPGNDIACFDCHDTMNSNDDGIPYSTIHPPVAKRDCSACHDPHASKYDKFLKNEGNALCLGCHEKTVKASGHHPLKYRSRVDSIVIEKGFKKDGDNFACIGCHNPHVANFPALFYGKGVRTDFCRRCHITMQ